MPFPLPIYVIGDIHGQLAAFEKALRAIEEDGGTNAPIVIIGDLVDRGADSRRVIDLAMEQQASGKPIVVLKGNHDRMFEYFMQSPPRHDPLLRVGHHWFHEALGSVETMASYSVEVREDLQLRQVHERALEQVPEAHVAFLKTLPTHYDQGEVFFLHAGIRPNIQLEQQTEDDLLWIRKEFLDFAAPHSKLMLHGHTPEKGPKQYSNRINVDGGAGYGRPLVPVAIEAGEMRALF